MNFFAGTYDDGILLSTDHGAIWTQVNSGLTNLQVVSLATIGAGILAGTGSGVFLSTDDGANWSKTNTGLAATTVNSLIIMGNSLFAGSAGLGVFRSTDYGGSWTEVNSGLTDLQIGSVATNGTNLFNRPGTNRKQNPAKQAGDYYAPQAYGRAITYALERAFPLPPELAQRDDETIKAWKARLTDQEKAAIKKWRKQYHWHPHQLRHNAATELRREFGLDTARVILGHRSTAAIAGRHGPKARPSSGSSSTRS
jgi:hypothetical protein